MRIAEIPNLTFLRYEDYRRGSDGAWGYVTRADGSGSYGDFNKTDAPDSADLYFRHFLPMIPNLTNCTSISRLPAVPIIPAGTVIVPQMPMVQR